MPPIRLILLLAASLLLPAALAAPRPQSYTTKVSRCFNRDACQEITLERLNTNNPKLNRWADNFLKNVWEIPALDRRSIRAWLRKNADKDDPECVQYLNGSTTLYGETTHYAVIRHTSSYFTCNTMHDYGRLDYHVIHRSTGKPLWLRDIVVKGRLARLYRLQKQAWIRTMKTGSYDGYPMTDEQIHEHLHYSPFRPSNNWHFNRDSLVFQFQAYQLGGYDTGKPFVRIGLAELRGIIKPEILREAQSYRGQREPDKSKP